MCHSYPWRESNSPYCRAQFKVCQRRGHALPVCPSAVLIRFARADNLGSLPVVGYSCRLGCLSSFDSESISWQKREQQSSSGWQSYSVRHIDISQRISHWSRIAASATSLPRTYIFQDLSCIYVLAYCTYEMCGENLDGSLCCIWVRFARFVSFVSLCTTPN